MNLSDFDYHLPPELIATEPAKKRDQSRLLVLDKKNGKIEHKHFFDLLNYLQPGDLLVANNSKVIPARLIGKKSTGGEVEVFLSKNLSDKWECLIKGRVKAGTVVVLSKKLKAEIVEVLGDGVNLVKFNLTGAEFMKEVEKIGQVPLPPYIEKRRRSDPSPTLPLPRGGSNLLPLTKGEVGRGSFAVDDRKNYQTVYADNIKKGSVAAPTAGLHFTPELIKKIKAKGVGVEYLTLHVGLGTFLPVKTEKIEEHKIHSEYAEIPQKTWEAIIKAKATGKRIIAVGTTTARTLEFFAKSQGSRFKFQVNQQRGLSNLKLKTYDLKLAKPLGFAGWVDIFIYPPYKFKVVDALVTNFHLPKSTLLMLVSALATKKHIDKAYQEAIKAKYRFYSYGDAMLIQ